MSVIINEMEVAAPQPAPAPPGPGAEAAAPPVAAPRPLEMRDLIRHLEERHDRVAAD